MPSRAEKQNIRKFARGLFLAVNFTDIYGRHIGYDYSFILAKIKEKFPEAKTSRDGVRKMASDLNQTEKLPVRGRDNKGYAHAYAMVLLLRRSGRNVHSDVRTEVKRKFPSNVPDAATLRRLDDWLRHSKFTLPSRS